MQGANCPHDQLREDAKKIGASYWQAGVVDTAAQAHIAAHFGQHSKVTAQEQLEPATSSPSTAVGNDVDTLIGFDKLNSDTAHMLLQLVQHILPMPPAAMKVGGNATTMLAVCVHMIWYMQTGLSMRPRFRFEQVQ